MDKQTGLPPIDWTPILWVGGIVTTIIGTLFIWCVLLVRNTLKNAATNIMSNVIINRDRLEKHESWILTLQRQVDENQKQTQLAIQAITINQDQDRKRFETFDKDFADRLIAKIRAITPEEKKKKR